MTEVTCDAVGVTVCDGASDFINSLANQGLRVCSGSGWWFTVAVLVAV